MMIKRVETVILALEQRRKLDRGSSEKINGLILNIRANAYLSPEEEQFIDDILIAEKIKPVFQRGVSC